MDEFLNNFFPSSWSDTNATQKSSWASSEPSQSNGLLRNSMGVYESDEKNLSTSLIPSSHIMESLVPQDNDSKPSLHGVNNGNSKAEYMGLRLNTTTLTPGLLNLSSPKLLPGGAGSAKSPRALPESGSVGGSSDSESSGFQQSLIDSHSLTPIPQLWSPSSYGCLSSVSPAIGQDNLQEFGSQEEYVDANDLGNRYLADDKTLELDNLSATMSANRQEGLHGLSSFPTGPQIALMRSAGLLSQRQMPQSNEGNSLKHYINHAPISQLQPTPAIATGGCNGAAKPRVRARRGQATDPHSIAERLRREKIAERMKNLQELVPNTNKTDKASMLDEIIEYVKFLQLQVKVLSMSRLGATGAVVPLITDSQAEGSNGLLLKPLAGQGVDLSESPDNIAFEQEVVKLMESNVTMAMQYLQSKGLCLMPVALATAISGGNVSSYPNYLEKKKSGFTESFIPHNGSPSDGETVSKISKGIKTMDGADIKQEEVKSTSCSTREFKPKP